MTDAREGPASRPGREDTTHRSVPPLDLTLHVGIGKTGTTSIQGLLSTNRAPLSERGVLYPSTPGNKRHIRFGLYVTPDGRFSGSRLARQQRRQRDWRSHIDQSPQAFREVFRRRLLEEIGDSGLSRVILSDEALFRSQHDSLQLVGDFAATCARHLRVVCYLRRQDAHLISRYQQAVKWGEVRRLAERTPQLDVSTLYDYHSQLDAWHRQVAPDELVVRRFSREAFVGNSLYQDFFAACGLDISVDDLEPVARKNESLDAESVEFLRILNLLRVRTQGASPGDINNRSLVRRLAEGSQGPVLTMTESELDAFMDQWTEGNRAVAQRWFGEDGELFPGPRRTEGTSRQHLDPARLDFFLDVTRLPKRLHAPMRQQVEHEAMGG